LTVVAIKNALIKNEKILIMIKVFVCAGIDKFFARKFNNRKNPGIYAK
jgi:hypothetical protein